MEPLTLGVEKHTGTSIIVMLLISSAWLSAAGMISGLIAALYIDGRFLVLWSFLCMFSIFADLAAFMLLDGARITRSVPENNIPLLSGDADVKTGAVGVPNVQEP